MSFWLEDREPEKDVSDESDDEESDRIEPEDNVSAQDNTEKDVIKIFLDSSCGCKVYNGAPCSQNFSGEALSHMRADNL